MNVVVERPGSFGVALIAGPAAPMNPGVDDVIVRQASRDGAHPGRGEEADVMGPVTRPREHACEAVLVLAPSGCALRRPPSRWTTGSDS